MKDKYFLNLATSKEIIDSISEACKALQRLYSTVVGSQFGKNDSEKFINLYPTIRKNILDITAGFSKEDKLPLILLKEPQETAENSKEFEYNEDEKIKYDEFIAYQEKFPDIIKLPVGLQLKTLDCSDEDLKEIANFLEGSIIFIRNIIAQEKYEPFENLGIQIERFFVEGKFSIEKFRVFLKIKNVNSLPLYFRENFPVVKNLPGVKKHKLYQFLNGLEDFNIFLDNYAITNQKERALIKWGFINLVENLQQPDVIRLIFPGAEEFFSTQKIGNGDKESSSHPKGCDGDNSIPKACW